MTLPLEFVAPEATVLPPLWIATVAPAAAAGPHRTLNVSQHELQPHAQPGWFFFGMGLAYEEGQSSQMTSQRPQV